MFFELGPSRDVCERVLPLLGRLGQRHFVDVLGVGADRVAARAEAAVHRTDVERQKERLVDVAVDQPGHRRVLLFVQRVERQARMIGKKRRGERNELPPDRVVDRIVPIDEGDRIRRDSHRHRRLAKTGFGVSIELRRAHPANGREQLVGRLHGLALLPEVVQKRRLVHLRVRRNVAPELALLQVLVLERFGRNRRLEVREFNRAHKSDPSVAAP